MTPRILCLSLVVALTVVLHGCGGSGGGVGKPPAAPGGTQTYDLGAVRAEVAASAGFNLVHFDAGENLPVAFTCLYGASILTLDEWGYGQLAAAFWDGQDWGICSLAVDGWGQQVVKNSHAHDLQPAVSPDGNRIAYTRVYGDGHSDVWVMNANGSSNTNVTQSGHNDYSPTWDPAIQRIAFVSDRDGNAEIHTWTEGRVGITQVTDIGGAYDPAWSPDGRSIAFSDGDDIFTCSPTGDDMICVGYTAGPSETEPCWSPDGAQLAYSRLDATLTECEVWAMNADGTNQRALTHDPYGAVYSYPAWSPDGRRIAIERYYGGGGTNTNIDMIDLSSGLVTHVTYGAEKYCTPAWFTQPWMIRRLIGPGGSDHGADPSLGDSSGAAIVGIAQRGLASAASVHTRVPHRPSLQAEALPRTGSELAGLAVTGDDIRSIKEDTGRAKPLKIWAVREYGLVTHVVIFFSGETGRIVSVIAGSDAEYTDSIASAGTITLRGTFTEAYDARDPSVNRLGGEVAQVALDARTGEVLSSR